MTRTEQIQEILRWWEEIVEDPYVKLQGDDRLEHLVNEGFDIDDIIEACAQMS